MLSEAKRIERYAVCLYKLGYSTVRALTEAAVYTVDQIFLQDICKNGVPISMQQDTITQDFNDCRIVTAIDQRIANYINGSEVVPRREPIFIRNMKLQGLAIPQPPSAQPIQDQVKLSSSENQNLLAVEEEIKGVSTVEEVSSGSRELKISCQIPVEQLANNADQLGARDDSGLTKALAPEVKLSPNDCVDNAEKESQPNPIGKATEPKETITSTYPEVDETKHTENKTCESLGPKPKRKRKRKVPVSTKVVDSENTTPVKKLENNKENTFEDEEVPVKKARLELKVQANKQTPSFFKFFKAETADLPAKEEQMQQTEPEGTKASSCAIM